MLHTSKKPLMKLLGNLALGSSSARKYLSTCDVCFQKFRVSCSHLALLHPVQASIMTGSTASESGWLAFVDRT
jgi:hypothetical protein